MTGDQAELGAQPGSFAVRTRFSSRRKSRLEVALRQLPLPEALVDVPQFALDIGESLPVAESARRLVAGERLTIRSQERVQVSYGLVQPGDVRVFEREGRVEVGQSFGVCVQGASVLAGQPGVMGRLRVASGQLVVVRDLAGQRTDLAAPARAPGERLGHATVQEPPPRQAGLLVDEGAQLLVDEVVDQGLSPGFSYLLDELLAGQL